MVESDLVDPEDGSCDSVGARWMRLVNGSAVVTPSLCESDAVKESVETVVEAIEACWWIVPSVESSVDDPSMNESSSDGFVDVTRMVPVVETINVDPAGDESEKGSCGSVDVWWTVAVVDLPEVDPSWSGAVGESVKNGVDDASVGSKAPVDSWWAVPVVEPLGDDPSKNRSDDVEIWRELVVVIDSVTRWLKELGSDDVAELGWLGSNEACWILSDDAIVVDSDGGEVVVSSDSEDDEWWVLVWESVLDELSESESDANGPELNVEALDESVTVTPEAELSGVSSP